MTAGEKLPSTRSLSDSLKVSRNSIIEAYEQLCAEGYTESRHGSGTRVAVGLNKNVNNTLRPVCLTKSIDDKDKTRVIDFRSGVPALDKFPLREWKKSYNKVCEEAGLEALDYGRPEGIMELRQALSEYLLRIRGISCSPQQILITSGATQALSLVAKLLFKPGGEAIIEDPSSYGLFRVIGSCGYRLLPAPVDSNGIEIDCIKTGDNTKLIYVTPSHQYPLGGILSIQRRLELIELAQSLDCYIIEDDYDSEFRYAGYPISALYSLNSEKVIYIGSFSKTLSPALRLGYIILPESLIKDFRRIKRYSDVQTAALEQLALADFIKNGHFERHISRMKKLYYRRQQALLESLDLNFKDKYVESGYSTGLHMVVDFKGVNFTESIIQKALAEGVKLHPVEFHAIQKGLHESKVIIGYSNLTPETIQEGIQRLKTVL